MSNPPPTRSKTRQLKNLYNHEELVQTFKTMHSIGSPKKHTLKEKRKISTPTIQKQAKVKTKITDGSASRSSKKSSQEQQEKKET